MTKRVQEKISKTTDAYLTVYLTLVMTAILSLCLTLIEGARKNVMYLEAECVTDIGLNSALAEYHRALWEEYDLLAVDMSYGTILAVPDNTRMHMEYYIERNLTKDDIFLDWLLYRDFLGMKLDDISIDKARLFTDLNGAVLRRRAAQAMLDKGGLSLFEDVQKWLVTVDSKQMTKRDIAAEKAKLDKKLQSYDGKEIQVSETEWITITVKNPTSALEKMRKAGILKWVLPENVELSGKKLIADNYLMYRAKTNRFNQGNLDMKEEGNLDPILERFLFQEYLISHMGYYGQTIETHALDYQLEYLLIGKAADADNLRETVNQIFAMREVSNLSYLQSNQEKCAIADGLGSVLATGMGIPESSELIKDILLFGWSFAESLYDLQCLLDGGCVPLVKTDATWHYDLQNALKMSAFNKNKPTEGLQYCDYLRILLSLEPLDNLSMRAMNMIESDIRMTPGNEAFRLDGCMDEIGVVVKINSGYGYDCEIHRRKGYATQ